MRNLMAVIAMLAVGCGYAWADVKCSGRGCGDELVAQGWKRIAQCMDHNWSYLLQKDERIVVCTGVSGRAGPIEDPCQAFKGNLDEYRAMARSNRRSGECVLSSAVTGEK
jgi:hypothetical protein